MKRRYYNKYDSGNVFLISLLGPLVLSYAVVFAIVFISSLFGYKMELDANNTILSLLLTIINQLGFFLIFFVYSKYKKINAKCATNFTCKLGSKNYLILILLTIIALLGLNYFLGYFDWFFKLVGYNQSGDLPFPLSNFWWLLVNVFVLAVLPAVCEELVFRGVILNGFRQSYGNKIAIFGSALLFSLIHASPLQTIYPFIFGIILAYVCVKTNSLFASMLMHFFNNFIVVIITYIEQNYNIIIINGLGNYWYLWTLLISAIAFGLIWLLIKKLKPVAEIDEITLNKIEIETASDDAVSGNIENANYSENQIQYRFSSVNYRLWLGVVIGVILWLITLFSNF